MPPGFYNAGIVTGLIISDSEFKYSVYDIDVIAENRAMYSSASLSIDRVLASMITRAAVVQPAD